MLMRTRRAHFAVIVFGMLIHVFAASPAFPVPVSGAQNANVSRTVTDEVGRTITVPAQVKRVVSLAPNLTETVYALGLEDLLVGDTILCAVPEAAKSKPHVGDPQNPSVEAILALHPDLVLATTSINRVETADALKRLGIPVYTSDPHTVRGMLDSTVHIADVMGAPEQGAELVGKLNQRLEALHTRLSERPMVHVLFIVWLEPLQSIGPGTFIADALRWAGAESMVTSTQSWPRISIEEVVRLQPDYIVFSQDDLGPAAGEIADLRSRPVWRDLDAVELGHVVNISEAIERPSPDLVDVIEQLARDLHPDAFSAEGRRNSPERPARLYARNDIDFWKTDFVPIPTSPTNGAIACAR
jgi:cobalamin transport system substrate-binding protein